MTGLILYCPIAKYDRSSLQDFTAPERTSDFSCMFIGLEVHRAAGEAVLRHEFAKRCKRQEDGASSAD
jgi:hypothetical protein